LIGLPIDFSPHREPDIGNGPGHYAGYAGRQDLYREDQRALPLSLYQLKGTPAEYKAGLDRAIAKGWLILHESGTYVRFIEAGAALFA
jgi:hypothetical protein